MAERKVLTRTESQALTREALLDAGETLFLKDGYYTTSLAAIANEAGRTIGAVYSNYSSKEELCLAVLKRRTSDEIASLMSALVASDDDLDSRLNVIALHWNSLCKDENLFLLAAEYGVSITRQPHQRQRTIEVVERTVAAVQALVEDFLPPNTPLAMHPELDRTVQTIIATGFGLATLQALGTISAEKSALLLTESIKKGLNQLVESAKQTTITNG